MEFLVVNYTGGLRLDSRNTHFGFAGWRNMERDQNDNFSPQSVP